MVSDIVGFEKQDYFDQLYSRENVRYDEVQGSAAFENYACNYIDYKFAS